MRNVWVQKEFPLAQWSGDLAAFIDSPDVVTRLLMTMVRLAGSHGVAIVNESAVADRLREMRKDAGRIECSFMRSFSPRARVSWFDRANQLVEGEIDDLGHFLRSLEPVEGAISRHDSAFEQPLGISGSTLSYDGRGVPRRTRVNEQIVTFSIYSDIWFPFVTGEAHPSYDGARYFDNRELAMRHTPRLNAFLDEISAAVLATGGT